MSISQSRANSRGPLIAVIKIEIYDDQVDRIFLHQNDDDYKLAQQFQQKHRLNSVFVDHIYMKIRASRESLQKDTFSKSPVDSHSQRSVINSLENKMATPYEHRKQDTYRRNDDTSTPFQKIARYEPIQQQQNSYPTYLQESNIPHAQFESTEVGNRGNFKNSNQLNNVLPSFSRQNKNTDTMPFETFMNVQSHKGKQFIDYNQQKRKQANSHQTEKRLIQKDKAIPNLNFESIDDSWYQKQARPQSLETTKTFDYRQDRNRNKKSNCSFNEDKPERVKVLKKSEMQSMQSSQKSLSKQERTKIAHNVTSRLYNESQIKKNYLKKIKERAKIEKQEKDDKELTYKPQINKVSQIIAADRYKDMPVQDYLVQKAKSSETRIEAQRALRLQRQLQNCSFQPKVNVISQKLARQPAKLQRDSSSRALEQCQRNHVKSQTGFRPSLNKMSEQIVKMKGQGKFDQRLKQFLERKNNKLKEMTQQKKIRQKQDQSGQPLFRPRISTRVEGRSPKGKQVYDYLYELSKVEKKVLVEAQMPKISQNSQQIMQQVYMKRIAWLFSELDSDQDGFISPKRICIDSISQSILEVIIPVLFEMEEMDIELNLQDFRNAIKNLHPSLNLHQKSILYSYNKAADLENKGK